MSMLDSGHKGYLLGKRKEEKTPDNYTDTAQ